jgi:hypothetical protein
MARLRAMRLLATLLLAALLAHPAPPAAASGAPISPVDRGPSEQAAVPAFVTVVQQAAAPAGLAPGSPLSLTIVATNHGHGRAANTVITLPLSAGQVQLREATFSRAGAWVRRIAGDAITIQTGTLGGRGDTITATLRLAVAPKAQVGQPIVGQLRYHWRDAAGGGDGQSNALDLALGRDAPPAVATLLPAGTPGRFTAAVFAPGEPVALWYRAPDGAVVSMARTTADGAGAIRTGLPTDLAPGSYTLIACGVWSGLQASVTTTVP